MSEITTVITSLSNFLAFRRSKNTELFAKCTEEGEVQLFTKGTEGLLLSAIVGANNPSYRAVLPYCNKPLAADSLMLRTHDFGNSTTWGESSLYHVIPYSGYKLVITSIVARFPANLDLSVNNLHFKIFKSYDGVKPVTEQHQPVVNDVYSKVTDLLQISNSTATTVADPSGQFSGDMYEIKFRYADSDMSNTSKLTLSSKLGEFMEIGMDSDSPLVDKDGNTITDPCYLFFNTKRMDDF